MSFANQRKILVKRVSERAMKDFFKKTWVKIAGWVCIILGTVVLFLGGTGVADINSGIALVVGIIEAVGLLITFIISMINKKQE